MYRGRMAAAGKTWMQRHTWQVYAAVAAIWFVLFVYQLARFASPTGDSPLMMVLTGVLTVVYGVLAVVHRRRRTED
jgi:uncharacterized membrane protein YeiH